MLMVILLMKNVDILDLIIQSNLSNPFKNVGPLANTESIRSSEGTREISSLFSSSLFDLFLSVP